MKRLLLVSTLVLPMVFLFSGCATVQMTPTPEQLASADYGEPVTEINAQMVARIFFKDMLKDPKSARYKWGDLEKAWCRINGRILFGYRYTAYANAKNSFGGYTGFSQYQFYFRNDHLIALFAENGTGEMELIYQR